MQQFKKWYGQILFFIACTGLAHAQSLKPGDVSPDAKYLEVDAVYPFNMGASLVRKGTSTSIIDKRGEFLAPFNKYNIRTVLENRLKGFQNCCGYFTLGPEEGILTSDGKVIGTKTRSAWAPTPDCRYIFENLGEKWGVILVDRNNNTKTVMELADADLYNYNNGLAGFRTKESIHGIVKYGYKDITGKVAINPLYDDASPFSDGMALVGQKNQFDELKYGYIDTTGKLVIPFMYSVKPEGFYGETAIVYPKNETEFEYALINKKGEVIRKFTRQENNDFGHNPHQNFHGVRFSKVRNRILAFNGKIFEQAEFLATLGIKPTKPYEQDDLLSFDYGDGKFYYTRKFDSRRSTEKDLIGYVDIYSKKIMEGPFVTDDGTAGYLFFDKVSKLAYARMLIGKNSSNFPVYRTGFINEDGIFVIIVKQPSTF